MRVKNYYAILGIPPNSTQDEIKAAYRKLVRQFHPDRNYGNESHFKLIQEAYEILSDDRKRDRFDAQLAYETYTTDPVELAKFLRDQKNKPKRYKPAEEDDEEPERKFVFNSTTALIAGIVFIVAVANVLIFKNVSFDSAEEVNYSNYTYDDSKGKLTEEYFQKAMHYFREKNIEFALMYFKKAIELSPDAPKLYFNRGLTYYLTKDYRSALHDLNQTVRLNQNFKNAYWVRAKVKYDMDDNAGAIEDFTEAIKYDAHNDSLYFNRGLAYYYTNNYDLAIRDIDKAIELNPHQGQYYFDRGDAKEMAGDEDGTCSDWIKAKEMGYTSPEFAKKPCIASGS